jgi:2,5-diketo-D-gluconate reductase A
MQRSLPNTIQLNNAPLPKTIRLNNGIEMPRVIYGAGGAHTQDNVTGTTVALALALSSAVGFTGVDTANHYHNQVGVRDGIAASGTPRNNLWVQTKVEPCGHSIVREGHCHDDTLDAFEQNLQQLAMPSVDMTLIHAPPCVPKSSWADPTCLWDSAIYPHNCDCAAAEPCAMMQEQWRALEAMYRAGKTRAIGVSNFCPACLRCLAKASNVTPAVNQLQFHAGVGSADPRGLLSYNTARSIVVQAYSPLGGEQVGALLTSNLTRAIGVAHGKSSATVVLRWVTQLGYALTAASFSREHMLSDLDVFDWSLTDEEMTLIAALQVAPDDPTKNMCLYD